MSPSGSRLALVAPLPAIALGAAIAVASGVPVVAYVPNTIAVVIGIALVLMVGRSNAAGGSAAAIAALAIVATVAIPGHDGVTRWLPLGPVSLHASAAFAPWLLVGLRGSSLSRATLLLAATQVVHLAQPDAGQATALAAGTWPLFVVRGEGWSRWGPPVVMTVLAIATWWRDDPLAPLPHVEGTLGLAIAMGPLWTVAAALALAVLAWPLVRLGGSAHQLAALAYLAAAFAVTVPGHFPVPVVGAGAGPVLGWYALLVLASHQPP